MEKIYLAIMTCLACLVYWLWIDKSKLADHIEFLKREIIREQSNRRPNNVVNEGLNFLNQLFGDQLKYEINFESPGEDQILMIRIYKESDGRDAGITIEFFNSYFPFEDIIKMVIKDNYFKGIKLFPEFLVE